MCSSLLGLGGTHVQQCSECRISRICVPHSHNFKRNSIAASYQHHAGLQPANLVTATTVPCSRSSKLFGSVLFVFFSHYFFNSSSILSFFDRLCWRAISIVSILRSFSLSVGDCYYPRWDVPTAGDLTNGTYALRGRTRYELQHRADIDFYRYRTVVDLVDRLDIPTSLQSSSTSLADVGLLLNDEEEMGEYVPIGSTYCLYPRTVLHARKILRARF